MSSPRVFVVVTAAGQSRRMGGTDKLTLPLHGRPLLAVTAQVFLAWDKLETLTVTVTPGRESELEDLLKRHCSHPEKVRVVAGGNERQDSVRLALEPIDAERAPAKNDFVLIHDGARPFVDTALFEALLETLATCDGVIPATPVRDTVKRVDGGAVLHTEDRETLRLVQTPQAFRLAHILELHRQAKLEGYLGTDDASLVERYGGQVRWIAGPPHNLKVTVPEDIALLSPMTEATQ